MAGSNCSEAEFTARRRELAAAILSGTKAPERHFKPLASGAVTKCIHAVDTGERAFVNLPCRGNRIICRRVEGFITYAAGCRPGKCKFYTEKEEI